MCHNAELVPHISLMESFYSHEVEVLRRREYPVLRGPHYDINTMIHG